MKISMGVILFFLTCGNASERVFAEDLRYFPVNYDQARQAFLDLSKRWMGGFAGASVSRFQVPSRMDNDLWVDFLELHAADTRETLIVIVSGIHGSEGFAGSAIQTMLIREILPGANWSKTGLLMVHAMNPYGFKYHRRVTENNVNLNRNFSMDHKLYSVKNHAYTAFAKIVEPQGPVTYPLIDFIATAFRLGFDLAMGNVTVAEMNQAIGQGQFEFHRGLEFGGFSQEPQTQHLISRLAEAVRDYRNVLLLDLHTGLGERRVLHLMPGDAEGAADPELLERLLKPQGEDAHLYKYTPNDSEGFYHTHGDLNNILPEILVPGQQGLALTMEFGTIGNNAFAKLQTLSRLILENQGFHHGYAGADIERDVKQNFSELFQPGEVEWRRDVISKSRSVFKKLFNRLHQSQIGGLKVEFSSIGAANAVDRAINLAPGR